MKIVMYDHCNGRRMIPDDVYNSVMTVLINSKQKIGRNTASIINKNIKKDLEYDGWSKDVRLTADSKITISSIYKNIGLCFQTGNVSRIYADLLKLQTLYVKGSIIAGIIIVPQAKTAAIMGSNIASYERLKRELPIFSNVINMPMLVLGFSDVEV